MVHGYIRQERALLVIVLLGVQLLLDHSCKRQELSVTDVIHVICNTKYDYPLVAMLQATSLVLNFLSQCL